MKIFSETIEKSLSLCRVFAGAMAFFAVFQATADDAEALKKIEIGNKAFAAEDYADAAEAFTDAELLADSTEIAANALAQAIEANRRCRMYYKEFQLIEKMLNKYPAYGDYTTLVRREYEIADKYRDGYRQPAFASIEWLSWLVDVDKTAETYTAALARAPYAEYAPAAKFDLALHQLRNYRDIHGRNRALDSLREIIAEYPGTTAAYYAQLELANALFQLTGLGDGDGAHAAEGIAVLEKFLEENPGAPERAEMETQMLKAKDQAANRLMGTADFYLRIDRPRAAEKYLARVLRTYPDSQAAPKAEKLLTELDPAYIPGALPPLREEERAAAYPIYEMPANYERLLIAPENSDGKWLKPIYDLNLPRRADEMDNSKGDF